MYDQYFGFKESPFSVTPDPYFFYDNPVYREAYASLRYGIIAKKGFIAITGEVGTGKTTLLRKLMREFDTTVHFASIFNTLLTFNNLLWVILRDLGVATKRKDRLAMVDDLNAYLVEQFKKGHLVCLLIDEAQDLNEESLEGLRLLSNLETNKQKLLQIVLIGQPELDVKLDKPTLRQLKQRIAIQCKIVPLNEEEVGAYINCRLGVADYHGDDLFEAEAIQKIALYSKGIPRLINILSDNALLSAFAASQKKVSESMIREAAGDLRLEPKAQRREAEHILPPSHIEGTPLDGEAATRRSHLNTTSIGIGALLLVVLFTAVFLSDPERFFSGVFRLKQNSTRKIAVATRHKVIPQKTNQETDEAMLKNTEVGIKWDHRVIIQYGSNVYEIATEAYGANAVLGLDLIKEFNPQIQNLNRVAAGQEIVLPPLTPETLVRHGADGSYRLVVASFLGRTEAEEFAGRVAKAGGGVAITARRVSDDILLYRVEIDGLRTTEEASRSLENGLKNGWVKFAHKPSSTGQEGQY